MARTTPSKPASNGPGRGSPRTRTAARPGERASRDRVRSKQVPVSKDSPGIESPRPTSEKALGVTWRLILLAVVIAALAVTLTQSLRVYFSQAHEIAALREEIEATRAEIDQLNDELTRWDDPAYVEAQARERLGWVMPGETGYRVIGVDGEPIGGDSAVLDAEEPTGQWWELMWGSVVLADEPAEHIDLEPEGPMPTIGPSAQPAEDE
ncbi:MAG: FtsB family cell division protein [Arachnia sp.]